MALTTGGGLLALGGLLLAGLLFQGGARPYLLLLTAELAAGREAAIPAGLAEGLSWPEAAFATTLIEWTMLLLGFPLLVLAGERLARVRRIESLFHRARVHAQENPSTGVLALGALTFTPFLPVGALTSVLVGEFLGLPSWRLVPMLMLAELGANLLLAYSAAAVLAFFPHPKVVAGVVSGALVLGAIAGALLARRRATSM